MRRLAPVLVLLLAVTTGLAQDSKPKKAGEEGPGGLKSGGVYRIVNVLSGHALDVVDSSRREGALLVQSEVDPKSQSQLWTLTKSNIGYKLVNKNSNRAIDVPRGQKRPGVQLHQWEDHGGPAQQWTIKKYAKGYGIGSLKSNLVLTVAGDAREVGAKIVQQRWTASSTQLWRFESAKKR